MFEEELEEETTEEELQEELQEGQAGEETAPTPRGEEETDPSDEQQEPPQQPMTQELLEAVQNQLFRQMVGNIPNPVTGKPFENPAEFAQWRQQAEAAQRAQQAGITTEQYQQIMQEAAQRVKQSDPEFLRMQAQVRQMQQHQMEETFSRDIAAIKAKYPDEQANSVLELGDDFMQIMSTGQLPAIVAYEAIRAKRNAGRQQPPSMGAVATGGKEEKKYFTPDDIDRMTPAEIEKNLDAINASMRRWK